MVIVFDNHFGTGEAGLSQEFFESDTSGFEVLKAYTTETSHKGSDGKPFKVILYQKGEVN